MALQRLHEVVLGSDGDARDQVLLQIFCVGVAELLVVEAHWLLILRFLLLGSLVDGVVLMWEQA